MAISRKILGYSSLVLLLCLAIADPSLSRLGTGSGWAASRYLGRDCASDRLSGLVYCHLRNSYDGSDYFKTEHFIAEGIGWVREFGLLVVAAGIIVAARTALGLAYRRSGSLLLPACALPRAILQKLQILTPKPARRKLAASSVTYCELSRPIRPHNTRAPRPRTARLRQTRASASFGGIVHKLGLLWFLCLYSAPLAAAACGPPYLALRVAAGATAMGSAVAIVPLRTTNGIEPLYWVTIYVLWALSFVAYLTSEVLTIPHMFGRRRKMFIFLAFVLALHLIVDLSQSSTTLVDDITIFGPLVLTLCVHLLSLPFHASHADQGDAAGGSNRSHSGPAGADPDVELNAVSQAVAGQC